MSEIRSYRENHSDPESASLFVLEYTKLPWQPQRMYLMQDFIAGKTRGNHAHKRLSQIFIMIFGIIRLDIYSVKECCTYNLSRASSAINSAPSAIKPRTKAERSVTYLSRRYVQIGIGWLNLA